MPTSLTLGTGINSLGGGLLPLENWQAAYRFVGGTTASHVLDLPAFTAQAWDSVVDPPLASIASEQLVLDGYKGRASATGFNLDSDISWGAKLSGATRPGGFIRISGTPRTTQLAIGINPYNNTSDVCYVGYNEGVSTVYTQSDRTTCYIAATLVNATRELKIYVDGVLRATRTVQANDYPSTARLGVAYDASVVPAAAPYYVDDLWICRGIMASSTIALMASGWFPGPTGQLRPI